MKEQDLLLKLISGDQSAFKELFDEYSSMVFNVCCRMLGNRHESEDITQDVFINAFRSIKHFRSDSKLSTWLYRIAVNHCLNYQSRKKRNKWLSFEIFSTTNGENKSEPSSTDNLPDILMEKKETEIIIQRAINSLPEHQRIALLLHRYEELSYEEIAKVMECSVSAVESRIFRGKQNLCKKLLPYLNQL
ncbi:MAG: RNA polymerase sigma factor [Ignavibacteriales bacterium]|nr:RNA polymerase sigma factor [Ignavibacteriales bacterium]